MSGKPDTWMPWYIGDYLADTMHLRAAEHGAYLLLIAAYWRNAGPLNDADAALAAVARCTPAEWRRMRPTIAAFFDVRDSKWHHKRVDAELAAAARKQARAAAGGAGKAAARKAASSDQAQPQAPTQAPVEQVLNASLKPAPQPSPSPISVLRTGAGGADDPGDVPLFLVKPDAGDWSKPLFRQGLAWLASVYGKPPAALRSTLGEALKRAGNDHKRVFDLLGRAQTEAIGDPRSWLLTQLGGGLNAQANGRDQTALRRAGLAGAFADLAGDPPADRTA